MHKRCSYLVLILVCLIQYNNFAQNANAKKRWVKWTSDSIVGGRISLNASYFGPPRFHPGIKVGAEWVLKRKITISNITTYKPNKPTKTKTSIYFKYKESFVNSDVAFYYHNKNSTSFLYGLNYGKRWVGKKGIYSETSFGIGYYRTFLPNVYSYEGGDYERKYLFGYNYFTIQLSPLVGIDLNKLHIPFLKREIDLPFRLYSKQTFAFMMPYNHAFGAILLTEVGLAYRLK